MCHIRPWGWDDETRIEPCSKAEARHTLDAVYRLHIHTRLWREREGCGKALRPAVYVGRTPREASFDWQFSCKEKKFFSRQVLLCGSGWSRTHCVHQTDLTGTEAHVALLHECRDQRNAVPHLAPVKKFGLAILLKAKLSHEHCGYHQSYVMKLV